MNKFWLSIDPDKNEDTHWVGLAEREPNKGWKAELIRPSAHPGSLFGLDNNHFRDISLLKILYDLQIPATLIYPYISAWGGSTFAQYVTAYRQKITLSFHHVITKLHIDDLEAEIVTSISTHSPSFAAWYDSDLLSVKWSKNYKKVSVSANKLRKTSFEIPNFGTLVVTEAAKAGLFRDRDKESVEQIVNLKIVFKRPLSTREALRLCFAIEHLFAFLIGARTAFPAYKLTIKNNDKKRTKPQNLEGELHVGHYRTDVEQAPSRFERLLTREYTEQGLEALFSNYLRNLDGLIEVIGTLNSIDQETDILSRFRRLVPVAEEFLIGKYKQVAHHRFEQLQKDFFRWVNQNAPSELQEFSDKHVNVIRTKKMTLNAAIKEALTHLPKEIFPYDKTGELLRDLRGKFMHTSPRFTTSTAQSLFEGTEKLKCLLKLVVLQDLGYNLIEIQPHLAGRIRFVPQPKSTKG